MRTGSGGQEVGGESAPGRAGGARGEELPWGARVASAAG